MREFRTTTQNFSPAAIEIDAAMRAGRLRHDGNPVLEWCLGNVVGRYDARANVYPRNERPEQKIDAITTVVGIARCLAARRPAPATTTRQPARRPSSTSPPPANACDGRAPGELGALILHRQRLRCSTLTAGAATAPLSAPLCIGRRDDESGRCTGSSRPTGAAIHVALKHDLVHRPHGRGDRFAIERAMPHNSCRCRFRPAAR
jgi:hypothetical protein